MQDVAGTRRSRASQEPSMKRFIFPQWTETLKKWNGLLVIGAPFYIVALIAYGVTPEAIRIGYQPDQPVPYSHALHAGELGMDCRYCHSTVERAPRAAIPPAATCMNCHSQVKKDSDVLQPIRTAFAEPDQPVRWTRVHDLPDYVYFNHMAHVNAAIGCDKNPQQFLRNPENVTKMGYDDEKSQPHRQPNEAAEVQQRNNIHPPIACSTCHR